MKAIIALAVLATPFAVYYAIHLLCRKPKPPDEFERGLVHDKHLDLHIKARKYDNGRIMVTYNGQNWIECPSIYVASYQKL